MIGNLSIAIGAQACRYTSIPPACTGYETVRISGNTFVINSVERETVLFIRNSSNGGYERVLIDANTIEIKSARKLMNARKALGGGDGCGILSKNTIGRILLISNTKFKTIRSLTVWLVFVPQSISNNQKQLRGTQ